MDFELVLLTLFLLISSFIPTLSASSPYPDGEYELVYLLIAELEEPPAPLADLLKLNLSSTLPTLMPSEEVTVTSNLAYNYSINHARSSHSSKFVSFFGVCGSRH